MAELTSQAEQEAGELIKDYGGQLRELARQIAKARGSTEATNRDVRDAGVHYKNTRTFNTTYFAGCFFNLLGGAGVGAVLQAPPDKGVIIGLYLALSAAGYLLGEFLKDKR